MNSESRNIDNKKRTAKIIKQPKLSIEETPDSHPTAGLTDSEKWRADLANILPLEWLEETVHDWADDENSISSHALTCSLSK